MQGRLNRTSLMYVNVFGMNYDSAVFCAKFLSYGLLVYCNIRKKGILKIGLTFWITMFPLLGISQLYSNENQLTDFYIIRAFALNSWVYRKISTSLKKCNLDNRLPLRNSLLLSLSPTSKEHLNDTDSKIDKTICPREVLINHPLLSWYPLILVISFMINALCYQKPEPVQNNACLGVMEIIKGTLLIEYCRISW